MQLDLEGISNIEELTKLGFAFIKERNFKFAEQAADRLYELKQYQLAINVYQNIIENNPEHDYKIDGLGNTEETIGYYEWDLYTWYKDERSTNRIKGSPYDALSLCCLSNSKYEAGIAWYKEMDQKYPKNYQIKFGYANILYNNGIYEQAAHHYEEVAKLKPQFIKPIIDLGLLYEYRRILKRRSTQKAKQVLALDKNNQYALFILARNEIDIDSKIKLLQEAWKLNINYTRVCNQVGICYGGTKKQYEQAIKWYQKCTEINPKYSSCYNNIGVNNQLLKRYEQAEKWYFRGVQKDNQYKTAYKNLTDVFDELKYDDEKILSQSLQYISKIDIFCYYIGLSYYDKNKTQKSIKWIEKAIELNPNQHRFYNSLAISYDEIKNYDKAIENYKKCIEIKPSYYSAYYNLAIVYKSQNKEDEAIEWYIKATEINPRYSYAYNNLGNIFKNQQNYAQAIKYYEKAIEFNSAYTLAYINLGVCHLNLDQYKEAFFAFEHAQELVNTDNNNLSQANKQFIKPHLQKFEVGRYKWKRFGAVTEKDKENLLQITKQFENSFDFKEQAPLLQNKTLLTKEFIELFRTISQGNFEIVNFRTVLQRIKSLYNLDKNTFYMATEYLFQYFWKKKFVDKFSYEDIQSEIQYIIGAQIKKELSNLPQNQQLIDQASEIEESLSKYEIALSEDQRVNLFQQVSYFTTYRKICNEVLIFKERSSHNLHVFESLVNSINNKVGSNVSTRISSNKTQQFSSILSVIQEIFKNEMGDGVKSQITAQINENVANLHNINLKNVAYQIYNTWNNSLTDIFLKERITNNVETSCFVTNTIEGECTFATIKDLLVAVTTLQEQCKDKGFSIISFSNQLLKKGQNSINIILRKYDFTFTLRLEPEATKKQCDFIRELRKIENSPFGTIYECLLSVSRGRRYALETIANHIRRNILQDGSEQVNALSFFANDILQKLPTRKEI